MCASVRIRTDTTLDQDCVLKATVFVCTSCTVCLRATVQVCTACMDVSLLTICVNFNTPPLAQVAPFDARFASQTRKKARLPTRKRSSFRVSKRPSWLMYNHSLLLKKRLLSLCHPRASLGSRLGSEQLFAKSGDQSVFTKFRIVCCSCFAPCSCIALALLIAVMIHSA